MSFEKSNQYEKFSLSTKVRLFTIRKMLDDLQKLSDKVNGEVLHNNLTEPEINMRSKKFYELNPVVDFKIIRINEEKLNITFPEEYVAFLTQLGNGGSFLINSFNKTLLNGLAQDLKTPFSPNSFSGYIEIQGGYEIDYWLIISGLKRGEIWSSNNRMNSALPKKLYGDLFEFCIKRLEIDLEKLNA